MSDAKKYVTTKSIGNGMPHPIVPSDLGEWELVCTTPGNGFIFFHWKRVHDK